MQAITLKLILWASFLRIPNFEQLKNKHVKVVIEASETQISDIDSCFDRFHYDLASQPFNRDEANAR